MPIYKTLVSFAGKVTARKGIEISISEDDAQDLLSAGYLEFVKDDPPTPFDKELFNEFTLNNIKESNLSGDDGLLAYADYMAIPLNGETKKDGVLGEILKWLNALVADAPEQSAEQDDEA